MKCCCCYSWFILSVSDSKSPAPPRGNGSRGRNRKQKNDEIFAKTPRDISGSGSQDQTPTPTPRQDQTDRKHTDETPTPARRGRARRRGNGSRSRTRKRKRQQEEPIVSTTTPPVDPQNQTDQKEPAPTVQEEANSETVVYSMFWDNNETFDEPEGLFLLSFLLLEAATLSSDPRQLSAISRLILLLQAVRCFKDSALDEVCYFDIFFD
jgi:hypothetical protein